MPQYDCYQTAFYLSFLSNITSNYTTSDNDALGEQYMLALSPSITVPRIADLPPGLHQPDVQPDVAALIGTWELAWGPAVVSKNDIASNSLFVAYCDGLAFADGTHPAYVVGIAGTNPYSAYDWIVEDFFVVKWVDFDKLVDGEVHILAAAETPAGNANLTTPLISAGTYVGLSTLLGMTPTPKGVEVGKTLGEYLRTIADREARIVFAGHSLGGALSPTLALYLKRKGVLDGFEDVYVYPSAGPTPGNTVFAYQYLSHFLPRPLYRNDYKRWNTNIVNSLDVVPHAWAIETMLQIPTIYGNDAAHPLPNSVAIAIGAATAASVYAASKGVIYTRINHWIDERTYTGPPPETFVAFLKILGEQHVQAYQTGIILPTPLNPHLDIVPSLPDVNVRTET